MSLLAYTNGHAPRQYSPDDLNLVAEYWQAQARESFLAFRQFIHPDMLIGWWVVEVSQHMQAFYERFEAGERPKMLLEAPPQHGKSTVLQDFSAWVAGRNPKLRTLYTSYSDDLGEKINVGLQRILDGGPFQSVFGARLSQSGLAIAGQRNTSFLEYMTYGGSFRNTTVNGQITGQGLDLGFVDDPLKGRKEANSRGVRDVTWNWLTDDFFTRFSDQAGFIMTHTRWHLDDPAGRLQGRFPDLQVLHYPAIAEHDEPHRHVGEALFPEFKSLDFLLERKALLPQSSWLSIYQQSPIVAGGGMFPVEKFEIVEALPSKSQVLRWVRYWDKAATEGGGKYTAGVLMAKLKDGTYLVVDVKRGQYESSGREALIKQTAQVDQKVFGFVSIYVEQEPGSGGKESAESTVKNLAGFRIEADRVTDSKHIRAEPYAAQAQVGNVLLLAGPWNKAFLDEHEHFPAGAYVDQVDAAAGAFAKLTLGSTYGSDMSWVSGPSP